MFRNLDENVYIKLLSTEDAIADTTYYPASGSFIDVAGFNRFAFLIGAGALDTALTFTVRQDTSATVTGSVKAITSANVTVGATDDDKWFLIEVGGDMLDAGNDFHFVSLYATGAAGANDYAAIFFLGLQPRTMPVTQPTGVAGRGGAALVVA